jgi:hypothetical protein
MEERLRQDSKNTPPENMIEELKRYKYSEIAYILDSQVSS